MEEHVHVAVQVLVAVHNAQETLVECVDSAMHQEIPEDEQPIHIDVHVCCYNDGSTDRSEAILQDLYETYNQKQQKRQKNSMINSFLWMEQATESCGAGHARNRAALLGRASATQYTHEFIAILDSDDSMHPHRLFLQVKVLLSANDNLLVGSQFVRDPPDATWHYTSWANGLSDERLSLERFREVTLLQPTWMLTKQRFQDLGGYVTPADHDGNPDPIRLIHSEDTPETLRLAEDLRLFHAHLQHDGGLKLIRQNLVTYRHSGNSSQSSATSRKLLVLIRAYAWEQAILSSCERDNIWQSGFAIWGAGRDGKDFFKALSPHAQSLVKCMADVDEKKLKQKWYVHREYNTKIPLVHISQLCRDPEKRHNLVFGRIDKGKSNTNQPLPSAKVDQHTDSGYGSLPIVVCVSLNRTNGALEHNVAQMGRTEGVNLWHFS